MAIAVAVVMAAAVPASANEPPEIGDFYCITDIGDYWTLTGVVVDYDDSVAGDVVTFGGVLAGYNLTTTVDADGTFWLTVELPGLHGGIATAEAFDPHGAVSDEALDWIWL
jgi:hypothetical protein